MLSHRDAIEFVARNGIVKSTKAEIENLLIRETGYILTGLNAQAEIIMYFGIYDSEFEATSAKQAVSEATEAPLAVARMSLGIIVESGTDITPHMAQVISDYKAISSSVPPDRISWRCGSELTASIVMKGVDWIVKVSLTDRTTCGQIMNAVEMVVADLAAERKAKESEFKLSTKAKDDRRNGRKKPTAKRNGKNAVDHRAVFESSYGKKLSDGCLVILVKGKKDFMGKVSKVSDTGFSVGEDIIPWSFSGTVFSSDLIGDK